MKVEIGRAKENKMCVCVCLSVCLSVSRNMLCTHDTLCVRHAQIGGTKLETGREN